MNELQQVIESVIVPQEAVIWNKKTAQKLEIGIPTEISELETRVPLTPEGISILVSNGHVVKIQTKAGIRSQFSDHLYSEVGALIVNSPEEVYSCQLILKVSPPSIDEIELMKDGSILVSSVCAYQQEPSFFENLNKKKISAIGFEFIEDVSGGFPIIEAMNEISGSLIPYIVAEHLSSQRGILMGGITGLPPTEIVILGTNSLIEYLISHFHLLGCSIKIFDKDRYKLQNLKKQLPFPIYTSIIDSQDFVKSILQADVVIGALHSGTKPSSVQVSKDLIQKMKPKSLLIDATIDFGKSFETSQPTAHKNPIFEQLGIYHYCVPNIPARVPNTASLAFNTLFTSFLLRMGKAPNIPQMIYSNKSFTKGIYTYKGHLTNSRIAEKFNMPVKDLDLLRVSGL